MREMVDWSQLPEELLEMIVGRLFSVVEFKRFRSICKTWRSSGKNSPFTSRPLIHFDPIPPSEILLHDEVYQWVPGAYLSRAAFFRVTLSSSPSKGWLIKSDADIIDSGKFHLLQPLTSRRLRRPSESLDLLEFTVTEIQDAYAVLGGAKGRGTAPGFQRSALVKVKEGEDHRYGVLGISLDGDINYWNGGVLRKLEQMGDKFSDIVVHKGLTYVLGSQGFVWLINSDLEISRYGSLLLDTNYYCGYLRFVECCGELYIVERLLKDQTPRNGKSIVEYVCGAKTVGFKVYKRDDNEELRKWVEVKSLGDNAFVIATDTCFSVSANEFYGCLKNSIYFVENLLIMVFKLDNGNGASIGIKSKYTPEGDQSCFQMFDLSFL